MNADAYTRSFATAFSTQDAAALAQLLAEDAEVVTATGQHCDGREAACAAFMTEFQGTFRAARLVSGRARLRSIGPGAALLSQRYVLAGATAPDGAELPRCALLLSAVLVQRPAGWQALSCHITALA